MRTHVYLIYIRRNTLRSPSNKPHSPSTKTTVAVLQDLFLLSFYPFLARSVRASSSLPKPENGFQEGVFKHSAIYATLNLKQLNELQQVTAKQNYTFQIRETKY